MKLTRRVFLAAPTLLAGASASASSPTRGRPGVATPGMSPDEPMPAGLAARAERATNALSFHAEKGPLFRFRAAFGRESGPKRIRDDERTPVGDYTLHPARRSARWRWFLPIDYPNAGDVARGRAAGLTRGQLGDEIGIHGFGDWPPIDLAASHGVGWNWTAGCISISYDELEIIRRLVQQPIAIRIEG